ncbi:class V aminotransferase [Sphingomonas sp. AX6]|uniref:class V aminotransferase n=1 Tax=Sphingomonas sp. AX6 TaxID=2653171 RepID=UPI0012F45D76|nr:class V aminotransferase [Sphingomonas sp. AX6]VXC59116.1 Class V aminotransferase [Sphingomonas sp. AX6]
MTSYKHLFARALAAAPDRLHMAAHSHHLWPDASWLGQQAAWEDAARLADRKWDRVMGDIWPAAQKHVADELRLPDPSSVVFAGNTHDLLVRVASAMPRRPLRILTSDGEFHSFRRQVARWEEAGVVEVTRVAVENPSTVRAELVEALSVSSEEESAAFRQAQCERSFETRFLAAARTGDHDLIFVSQMMFGTGTPFAALEALADLARPDGPWVVIDGYHGFMAVETDLSAVSDRVFYTAGGYKYAMAGEGCAFLHCPPGFGPRPQITGWYAEFDDLSLPPGMVGYAPDAMRFMGATFDPSGLYRFVAVRDMLAREELTTAVTSTHVDDLRTRLVAGLADTPLARAKHVNAATHPVARFIALRSPDAATWQAQLAVENVTVDVRGDVLRIGLGLYHDARDIDRFVEIASNLKA